MVLTRRPPIRISFRFLPGSGCWANTAPAMLPPAVAQEISLRNSLRLNMTSPCSRLEGQLQCELNLPGCRRRGCHHSRRRTKRCSGERDLINVAEIYVIENVEKFRTELKAYPLSQMRELGERKINIGQPRPDERPSSDIPERARQG